MCGPIRTSGPHFTEQQSAVRILPIPNPIRYCRRKCLLLPFKYWRNYCNIQRIFFIFLWLCLHFNTTPKKTQVINKFSHLFIYLFALVDILFLFSFFKWPSFGIGVASLLISPVGDLWNCQYRAHLRTQWLGVTSILQLSPKPQISEQRSRSGPVQILRLHTNHRRIIRKRSKDQTAWRNKKHTRPASIFAKCHRISNRIARFLGLERFQGFFLG